MNNYKDTLTLPKTDFEMRGNLVVKEPLILKQWKKINIYKQMQKVNEGLPQFVLHDGPPYANGAIHVGHALNKVLKDIMNKSKSMLGYQINFIPGWDTHGLPIEQKVTEDGADRKSMSSVEFRNLCHNYALEQIEVQKNQMLALGIIGRFDNPYITLKKEYESKQIDAFLQMYEKGLIFKDLKPIYWSPSSESALAEAEIEYKEKKSKSIYVTFEITKDNDFVKKGQNLLIWTTTPWTIPANIGVAVDEKIIYALVDYNGKKLIIAKELVEKISKVLLQQLSIEQTFTGKDIIGLEYIHPFVDKRVGKVVSGHHVTTETGTGLVHMAPSHGEDDFVIAKDNGLDIFNYIDDRGHFRKDSPIAQGEFWLKADKTICTKLEETGSLVSMQDFVHSYPHDWRTKLPVMFKATPQWFGSIAKIKDSLLNAIKETKWTPSWGEKRLANMIESRQDWCISRQRVWGVPIPIIYGEDNKPILDKDLNKHFIKLFEKYGSNVWFEREVKDLLPKGYKHHLSPNGKFKKEKDIMDVWFDSGSSFYAISKNENFPDTQHSMYLEGSDQYRGWFNSSLIVSTAITNKAPYKEVVSHGFTLDGKGEKMSKSKGNVIDPLKVIRRNGADILRLWVASTRYQADVRISDDILKQISENYRNIRFKIRFSLSNLFDFNPATNLSDHFSDFDKYILMKIEKLNNDCIKLYNDYDFGKIFVEINNVLYDVSTNYFDPIKSVLYVDEANSKRRRAIQTVLYYFVDTIIKILAPVLSFTMEEAYSHFNKLDKKASVLLERLKEEKFVEYNQKLVNKFDKVLKIKSEIYKEIEKARNDKILTKSEQAKVFVELHEDYKDILLDEEFKSIIMVAEIFEGKNNGTQYEHCTVKVEKTQFKACARCWEHKSDEDLQNDICLRCEKIVNN